MKSSTAVWRRSIQNVWREPAPTRGRSHVIDPTATAGRRNRWPGHRIVVMNRGGIDEQVAKAQRAVDGHAPVKRNRYIQLSGATKSVNRTLEAKARGLAGLKG